MSSPPRLWSTLVILKDHEGDTNPPPDVNGDYDLSNKYATIEYQDTYPRNAIITLNAKGGLFITKTPKIQKWDRIYLEITDQDDRVVKEVFQVTHMVKERPIGKGLQLRLYCSHQSSNLLTQTISRPNRRVSGAEAMRRIMDQMNINKGFIDPFVNNVNDSFDEVEKTGILLDEFTTNDYIFESIKADRAIQEIIDREGQPVEGGGSFEFFYFNFTSAYQHPSDALLNQVKVQCFPQGFMLNQAETEFTNIPRVTLTKPLLEPGVHANTLALGSSLEVEKGTNIVNIGDFTSGSWPTNYQKYTAAREYFKRATNWAEGNEYKKGILVTDEGFTYECIIAHTSVDPPLLNPNWLARLFDKNNYFEWTSGNSFITNEVVLHNTIAYKALQDHTSNNTNEPPNPDFWRRVYYVPTVDYSPLTKGTDGLQYWINASGGAKHFNTPPNFPFTAERFGIVDPSVVIRDVRHPRTWVDAVGEDSTNLPNYLFPNGNPATPFEAFRVLVMNPVDGTTVPPDTPGNLFFGNDINGRPFANNVVEFQQLASGGQYVVLDLNGVFDDETLFPRPPSPANNELLFDQEVYDYDEGVSWTNEPCEGVGAFVDNAGVCQLGTRNSNWIKGAYSQNNELNFGFFSNASFSCVHLPKFEGGSYNMQNTRLLNADTDIDGDSAIAIEFNPNGFDPSKIFEHFFGLNFAFPWPRNAQQIPGGAVVIGEQIVNPLLDIFNMDRSTRGERQWFGPQVEDFYPFQSFGFEEKIFETVAGIAKPYASNYSMGIWIADRRDNIWTIDYPHSHNDVPEKKAVSLNKRNTFRARVGYSGATPPPEVEILDIVDPRSIVRGGIYWKGAFNKAGQFTTNNDMLTTTDVEFTIDAFRFIKPLIATNNDEPNALPERNKEPQKIQNEKIVDYVNLKQLTLALEQIFNFRTDRYETRTPGRCNINYGDPVYYFDPEGIEETTDGIVNTIKGVASTINYSLSKTANGPGGFLRTVELTTRLWPEDP